MKFVFCGYDLMLGSVNRLIADGHELVGVFTFECDNIFNFNRETLVLAKQLDALSVLSKPESAHIDGFLSRGCECFISAGYPYKIPPIDQKQAHGINVHPSLLPKGRGLMPVPHIITNHPEVAGVTIHKLTKNFDEGDILYQKALPLHENETVETLSARIALATEKLLPKIIADLPDYWKNATPQNHGSASYFPPPDNDMRQFNWDLPVTDIDKTGRAFGRYGSLAEFDGHTWVVYDYDFWTEKHDMKPGDVAAHLSRETIIAAQDGFVCLKDFHKLEDTGTS